MKQSVISTIPPRNSTVQLPLPNHQTKNNQRMDAETNQHPGTSHWEDKNTVDGVGGGSIDIAKIIHKQITP